MGDFMFVFRGYRALLSDNTCGGKLTAVFGAVVIRINT